MDWLDLLAVQGTQGSSPTPQFKNINSSALSFLHGPTLTSIHDYRKIIALTRRTFVGKVMSLLFNALSRVVIAFLPKETVDGNVSPCVLWCQIAWVQIPALPLISNVISGSELASSSLSFLIYDIHGKTVTFVHFK